MGVIRWVLRQSIQGKRARRQRHGSHIARVENLGQRAASAEPAFVQRVELLAPDARGDRQRYLFLVLAKMEHHEYELYLQIEGIDHSKTQVRRPQSNGICERLHRTMQEEFYAVAFRKKMYLTLHEMQLDLDEWIKYYNNHRPHSGRYCFGKTPMETFRESIILAKQKLIGQPAPAA